MNIPPARYGLLPTEKINSRTRDLDRIPLLSAIRKISREDFAVPKKVFAAAKDIEKAARIFAAAYGGGRKIIFAGAGTSGRLGVIEAAECPPTFGTEPARIKALIAGGDKAVFRAVEGAEDSAARGRAAARRVVRRGDCVIGIAASGVTPYVLGVLRRAAETGCKTILVSSSVNTGLRVDVAIKLDTGPEAVAGSTRLKAATAAKLALNLITTAAMILLGKLHGGFMVDVRPGSAKLKARAARMVSVLCKVPPAKAEQLLRKTGYNVKTAAVMAKLDVSRREAERRLALAGGILRAVIG